MSNGYNFTERVRKVITTAREEAALLRQGYVGTEHLILGLLGDEEGSAISALKTLGINLNALRADVRQHLTTETSVNAGPDLPYTSGSKKVLELAMSESRTLRHNYVGTEHLLLGLLAEQTGQAALALARAGVTLETMREEVVRMLGSADSFAAGERQELPMQDDEERKPSAIEVTLHFTHGAPEHQVFPSAELAVRFINSR